MTYRRQSGSVTRTRNSSYEGLPTDYSSVPRQNSNSGGSGDTPPDSRRRDHNQEAANSQASNGQQPPDGSNTEYNEPSDPRNGKRMLNQAVTKFIGALQSSKRLKSNLKCIYFGVFFHLLSHLPL